MSAPLFAQRHYRVIVAAIRESRPPVLPDRQGVSAYVRAEWDAQNAAIDAVAFNLAMALGHDNPKFDRARFLVATENPS
jgi:hypothetical protein